MVCEKIETKDLILGKAKQEDLENIYNNYWCSEKSAKYMLWVPQKNLQEAIGNSVYRNRDAFFTKR